MKNSVFLYQTVLCVTFITILFSTHLTAGLLTKLASFNKKNRAKITEFFDNFHIVEEGKLYRTQQLKPNVLKKYLKRYHIKTVITLRGKSAKKNQAWWDAEESIVRELGATFIMLPMSATRLSSKEEITALLQAFDTAELPILIHCIGGADRTGEAAALWVLECQKESKQKALDQLSIKYGHRKYKNSAKDFLIEIWQGREWLKNNYNPTNYPQFKAQPSPNKTESPLPKQEPTCALQ